MVEKPKRGSYADNAESRDAVGYILRFCGVDAGSGSAEDEMRGDKAPAEYSTPPPMKVRRYMRKYLRIIREVMETRRSIADAAKSV